MMPLVNISDEEMGRNPTEESLNKCLLGSGSNSTSFCLVGLEQTLPRE